MNLTIRQKAFFLIVLTQERENALRLFNQITGPEKEEMVKLYQTLVAHEEKDVSRVALGELRKFSRSKKQSYFSEVHVDWIVDLLIKESPEVIAAILRYLPAERVGDILDRLPQEILGNMPRMSDTYDIPLALVELFQQKIENQFLVNKTFEPGQKFEFEHFCLLRADQIAQVFMALGYQEIALGLITLPARAREVVLGRLSPVDRRYVETYIKQTGNVSEKRLKRAQFHLISKEVQLGRSDKFVKALGFLVFSKMILMKDNQDVLVIKRKMSREEADQMHNFINAQIEKNSEASVIAYQEDLISAVSSVL